MTDKEKREFLYDLNLKEARNNQKNQNELTGDEIKIEKLLDEINELGYSFEFFMQLERYYDVRFINIFKQYIGTFKTNKNNYNHYNDSLIRMLGHPAYRDATEYCLEMYRNAPKTPMTVAIKGVRWTWGLTICNIKDPRYINEYLKIVSDDGDYSDFHQIILLLSKFKEVKAVQYILKYLDYSKEDKNLLNNTVIEALGNYRNPEYLQYITPFLTIGDGYTRNKAKAAIKKIENSALKQKY